MHHIYDYDKLIKNCKKILKKDGLIYIFEPLLRELHQIPEDYFRFTPFSLKEILSKNNFKDIKIKTSGGAFSAALYCLHQASEYLIYGRKPINLISDVLGFSDDAAFRRTFKKVSSFTPTQYRQAFQR